MPQFDEVHIAPNAPSAGLLRQALQRAEGRALLANHDHLSCGPLPPLRSLEEWRTVRDSYWQQLFPEEPALPPELTPIDLARNAPLLRDYRSIVLWVGTGLAEQLLLVWVLQLLRFLEIEETRLRVIQFSRVEPNGFEVVSPALLNADRLRAHPTPHTLDLSAIAEINAAWRAATSPEPSELIAYLGRDSQSLPYLRRSLRKLPDRYPDAETGLGIWDRLLLKYTAERGPAASRIIGYSMTDEIVTPDWVGDHYLFSRLQQLAAPELPHPLITLTGVRTELRGTEVRLTEAGHRVLRGEANAVQLNGIEDWVAGVRLDSRQGKVWFHVDGRLVPTS